VLNILSVCMCVCVCVCTRAWAWARAFVCVCVCVALITQYEKRMSYIILSSEAVRLYYIFSKLSHKLHDFGKRLFNINCLI